MIDAFKSTLEELTFTDVIILVIDISDSHAGPSPMLEPGDSRQFDLNFIFESGK